MDQVRYYLHTTTVADAPCLAPGACSRFSATLRNLCARPRRRCARAQRWEGYHSRALRGAGTPVVVLFPHLETSSIVFIFTVGLDTTAGPTGSPTATNKLVREALWELSPCGVPGIELIHVAS